MPLPNPFRRQPDRPSLRERAADLRASLTRPQQSAPDAPETEAETAVDWHSPPPGFMASPAIEPESFARIPDGIAIELQRLHAIAQAEFERRTDGMVKGPESEAIRRELRLDVLSMATRRLGQHPTAGGIAHGDGTVSFIDASGVALREPMARWVGFVAMQMHSLIQGEISRQRIAANSLDPEAYQAWEEGARRALRSDAVHALAFRHLRAFEAAQALRSGTEPATQDMRERNDAGLLALAPAWEAALDLLQRRNEEEEATVAAAPEDGWPGQAPKGTGPEWVEYLQQKEAWRERHGIIAAEDASSDAATALHETELRIAGLSAASLAGLKLKARVGQRHDDIGLDWPDNLGAGLARDILALTEARAEPSPAPMLNVANRDLSREAFDYAWRLSLLSVPFDNLTRLYDLFHQVSEILSDAGEERTFWVPSVHGVRTPGGDLLDAEQNRLGCLRDACADELTRRTPRTDRERDAALIVRVGHEMLCEGKIRDKTILAEITQTWGG